MDVKQVIVYRRDLGMRKGKIAAQCAHASRMMLLGILRHNIIVEPHGIFTTWLHEAPKVIVLSVENEHDMMQVHALARERDLPTLVVTDAGHTEFDNVPTSTVVIVGPSHADAIDAITGPDGLVPTKLA